MRTRSRTAPRAHSRRTGSPPDVWLREPPYRPGPAAMGADRRKANANSSREADGRLPDAETVWQALDGRGKRASLDPLRTFLAPNAIV